MQVQAEEKPYDDINITPMLDLAYVLLVIFILMCTASVQGVKVNLPKASAAPSLAKPKTKAISVNNEGKIFLDTVPVTLQELEQRLAQQKAQTPDFPVVIKGDSQTQYQAIMDVLDVLGRLGLPRWASQPRQGRDTRGRADAISMNYEDEYEKRGFLQKYGFVLGIGAIGITVGAMVIGQITKGSTAARAGVPEVVMIRPLPEPPPPPPPPPEPPKEVVEKMVEQEPIDQPEDKPDDSPKDGPGGLHQHDRPGR